MLMRWLPLLPLAIVGAAAELQVPPDVIVERGIDYTSISHGKLAMDIVRPKAPGKYPGIVMIHGGGFSAGTRDSYLPMAIRLAQNGYVAATVSYRLTPMFQFPLPVYDVKAAVRFLRANAGKFSVEKEHMGAIGGSAGGTWSQFLAVTRNMPQFEGPGPNRDQSSSVDCAISYYGRSDMSRAYEGSRNAAGALPQKLQCPLENQRLRHPPAATCQNRTPSRRFHQAMKLSSVRRRIALDQVRAQFRRLPHQGRDAAAMPRAFIVPARPGFQHQGPAPAAGQLPGGVVDRAHARHGH